MKDYDYVLSPVTGQLYLVTSKFPSMNDWLICMDLLSPSYMMIISYLYPHHVKSWYKIVGTTDPYLIEHGIPAISRRLIEYYIKDNTMSPQQDVVERCIERYKQKKIYYTLTELKDITIRAIAGLGEARWDLHKWFKDHL